MLKNFVPAVRRSGKSYSIAFEREDTSGFSFDCDANGNLLPGLTECAMENYRWCMEHPEEFPRKWNEFVVYPNSWTEPAHGDCVCGTQVELYNQYRGACQCPKCGRWYNLFGQNLIAPEYWEDDGE